VDESPPPLPLGVLVELERRVATTFLDYPSVVFRLVDDVRAGRVPFDAVQSLCRFLFRGVSLAAVCDDVTVVVDESPPPLPLGVLVELERGLARDDVGFDLPLVFGPGQFDFEACLSGLCLDFHLEVRFCRWADGHRLCLVGRDGVATAQSAGETAQVRRDSSPAPGLLRFVNRLFGHATVLLVCNYIIIPPLTDAAHSGRRNYNNAGPRV
jgi:hypothetical protein